MIIFPVVYIVGDILSEIYGYKKARKIILLGFLLNLLAVICYNIAIILPAPDYFTGQIAFQTVLSSTSRILVASFLAYIVGSLINSKVMVILKEKYYDKLFYRCIFSTLLGESCDAFIFITIAFIGTMPLNVLLIMIVAQALFKTIYEIIIYPITRKIILYVRELPLY